jgi:hypothetical protein
MRTPQAIRFTEADLMPNKAISEPVGHYSLAVPVTYTRTTLNSNVPDDLLAELLDDLLNKRPINRLSACWLERGILGAIRRNQSLDESLSLAGRGRDSLHRRLMMLRRNQYLVEAVQATAIDQGVTRWERCKRLSEQIKRFKRYVWPKTRHLIDPPDDWPAFKKCLWLAASTDVDLPESPDRLNDIVEQNAPFSCDNRGAKLLSQFL